MPDSPLATATPEQLEAWADALAVVRIEYAHNGFTLLSQTENDALLAAADLLRAVAKAERETDLTIYKAGANVFIELNRPMPDVKGKTIPAALASLLTTPPAGADDEQ